MTAMLAATIPAALGGAGLIVLRDGRIVIAALAVQWVGLIWAGIEAAPGLTRVGATEAIVALACVGVLGLTLYQLRGIGGLRGPGGPLSDYFVPVGVTLLGGVAGVGLATLFPLAQVAGADLVFYWTVLSGGLVLVLDGPRDAVKLAAGILAFLNASALLLPAVGAAEPGAATPALLALARVAFALLSAYGWRMVASGFGELSLRPLFDARDGTTPSPTALAVVRPVFVAEPLAASEEPAPEPEVEEASAPDEEAGAEPEDDARPHARSASDPRDANTAATEQADT
jgi:hypothetical protein